MESGPDGCVRAGAVPALFLMARQVTSRRMPTEFRCAANQYPLVPGTVVFGQGPAGVQGALRTVPVDAFMEQFGHFHLAGELDYGG